MSPDFHELWVLWDEYLSDHKSYTAMKLVLGWVIVQVPGDYSCLMALLLANADLKTFQPCFSLVQSRDFLLSANVVCKVSG